MGACNRNESAMMLSDEEVNLLHRMREIKTQVLQQQTAKMNSLGNPENEDNPWDTLGVRQCERLENFKNNLKKMVVYECKAGLNGPVLNAKENAGGLYYEQKNECYYQKITATSRMDSTQADLSSPETKLLNSLDTTFVSKTNCPINGGYLIAKATEANFFTYVLSQINLTYKYAL